MTHLKEYLKYLNEYLKENIIREKFIKICCGLFCDILYENFIMRVYIVYVLIAIALHENI